MPVDLNQLPIPDWGLRCPTCRYLLRGLPSHRCPECGTRLEMAEVVRPWTRLREPRFSGEELPFPDFGLKCATCGRPLAGAPQRVCPACGEPFDPAAFLPAKKWHAVEPQEDQSLPFPMTESILVSEQVPHIVHETRTAFGIAGWRLMVPSDFYFEVLWLIRQARNRIESQRAADGDEGWLCPQCNTNNPGGFELCWNCGAAR
jgi:rubrerythrin